jgi:hypothetical protein
LRYNEPPHLKQFKDNSFFTTAERNSPNENYFCFSGKAFTKEKISLFTQIDFLRKYEKFSFSQKLNKYKTTNRSKIILEGRGREGKRRGRSGYLGENTDQTWITVSGERGGGEHW